MPQGVNEILFPHNAEVEESILAAMLSREWDLAEIFGALSPDDFYITGYREIFERAREMFQRGEPVEAVAIRAGISDDQEKAFDAALLGRLMELPPAIDVKFSAGILKKLRARRQSIEIANAITKRAENGNGDLFKIQSLARQIVDGVEAIERGSSNPWIDAVIDFGHFIDMEIPERKIMIDPWLWQQSITLVSAWRGVGKTFFGLGLVDAITKGIGFGPWKTGDPVPCLYLDGEMPSGMLQERAREMKIGVGAKSPARLISINVAMDMGLPRSNLLDQKFRSQLKDIIIGGGFKFFVVDNVSSLMPEVEENAKESWDPIAQWALDLRFCGVSTLFLHHVSKAGTQRGHSGREDNVDTSIILKHPENYHSSDGCRFVVQFSKDRVSTGNRNLLSEYEFQYSGGVWTFASLKQKNRIAVLKMIDQGIPQKDIARELAISAGRVSQIRREATETGILSKDGKLTQSGFCEISKNT